MLVLSFVACGDDDDDGASAAADRRAFLAEGETLCAQLKSQLDRLFEDFLPTLSRRAAAYGQVVPLGRDFSRRFTALRPPEGDEARIRESLGHYDEGLDHLDRGVDAARAGDLDRSNASFDAAFAAFGRSDDILRSYGFEVCAEAKTNRGYFTIPEAAQEGFSDTKKAFLQQAEAVCRAGNERLRQLEASTFTGPIPSPARWREFLTAALPVFQSVVDQLAALEPPAEDRATIGLMVDTYRRALAAARQAEDGAAAGDRARFDRAMDDVARLTATADDLSTRYGFQECRER